VTTKKTVLIQFIDKKSNFFNFMRSNTLKNWKKQHTKAKSNADDEVLLNYAGVLCGGIFAGIFRKDNSQRRLKAKPIKYG
jgi:hypothetical protein